jgi:anti-sigma factor RsiW
MNDDDLWLDALLDDELDAAASLALQRRLATEPGLQRRFEERRALREAVRAQATRHAAPEALRTHLEAMLAPVPAAAQARPRPGLGMTRAHAPRRTRVLPWATGLGGALLASLCTLAVVDPAALGWHRGDALAAQQTAEASEAFSAHTRALLVDHPIEVASSDQHTVRPWLSARLNFVPPVADLADQGYPLAGARRDVLSGQTAAALVYRHGAHVISVFVRPAEPNTPPEAEATRVVRGFNVIERTQGGLAFCFVSDVNPHDLRTLADLVTPLAGK